jgi:twitching motility protein PilT
LLESGDSPSNPETATAPGASDGAEVAPERAQLRRDPRAIQFLDDMLRATHGMRASDLHLSSNMRPVVRKDGQMQPLEGHEVIGPTAMRELLLSITPDRNVDEMERMWDTDFAHEIAGVSRFRVNLFHDRHGMGGVFRVIPDKTPKPEDLGLPHRLIEMTQLSKGIVLVTGPTGSGKSTTLSALLDHINDTRRDHVITIEDPIEFVHQSRECLINQREVGTHAQTFKRALREALREDPDIVLVGEMRDLETVHIALETAETGHLVFGTLHTTSAPASIDRLIDQFPAQQQQQIRVMLADTLRCVVAQVLCRRKTGGRVAALEMMVCTPAIANLIREGKTHQIPSIMQTSKAEGMQLMTEALVNLVKSGVIEPEEALARATDRDDVWRTLERSELLTHQQAKPPKRR